MGKSSKRSGWVMILTDREGSSWGGVDGFYDSFLDGPFANGVGRVDSPVWGKVLYKDQKLAPGEGIAFYHSQRARFPLPDPLGGRARISLIGDIVDVDQDGQFINRLDVVFREKVLRDMRRSPIPRDERTSHLFEACGMVPGKVATYFEVPPAVWAEFENMSGHSEIEDIPDLPDSDEDENDSGDSADEHGDEGENDEGSLEGTVSEGLATTRLRSRQLRLEKIEEARARHGGRLECEVCRFNFETRYGVIGWDFIHVHHLTPLSSAEESGTRTRLSDLAVLCANCHAMVHIGTQANCPRSINELRALVLNGPHPMKR